MKKAASGLATNENVCATSHGWPLLLIVCPVIPESNYSEDPSCNITPAVSVSPGRTALTVTRSARPGRCSTSLCFSSAVRGTQSRFWTPAAIGSSRNALSVSLFENVATLLDGPRGYSFRNLRFETGTPCEEGGCYLSYPVPFAFDGSCFLRCLHRDGPFS